MARFVRSIHLPDLSTPVVVGGVMLTALLLGLLVADVKFGVRELIIFTLIIVGAGLVLMPSERILRFGFILWILTFAFGWRTLYLTTTLNIHPSEILAWVLFALVAVSKAMRRNATDFAVPLWIPLFMLFGLAGVATAVLNGRAFDVILEESKVFFVLVPTFYIVQWMIKTRAAWERAMKVTIWIAVYISLLGLMDFFAPSLSQALAGKPDIPTLYVSNFQSFGRVGFIFYGNFAAGFVIFDFFGLSVHRLLTNLNKGRTAIILNGLIVVVELAGMYLSGFRGLYYAIGVFLLAYAIMNRRNWWIVVAAIASVPLWPADFYQRFVSLFDTRYADSSQFDRINRATQALNLANQAPLLGWGWGGSGYVHSDLIQIGANLGVPAAGVFIVGMLSIVLKTFRLVKEKSWVGGYASVLFATLCGLVLIFASEGNIEFVQLTIPIWFLFAMIYKLADLAALEKAQAVGPAQEPN